MFVPKVRASLFEIGAPFGKIARFFNGGVMNLRSFAAVFAFFTLFFLSAGCENIVHEECSQANINRHAYAFMQDWYLWYDHLPDIDVSQFASLSEMISAVKYVDNETVIDRFSYALKKQEHDDYYAGKRYGMGFSMVRDENSDIYVTIVYPEGPAGKAGMRRGQKILSLNGVTVQELDENQDYNHQHKGEDGFVEKPDWNNIYDAENKGEEVFFKVLDSSEGEKEFSVILDDYTMNSVLAVSVLEHHGAKVGYLHFKSFIKLSPDELDAAFAQFKEAGIDELVVDMRYNGGGLVSVAEHLIDLIGGATVNDEKIIKILYNDKHTDSNYSYKGKKLPGSLDKINKIVFITTRGTASASEMVINALTPYFDVALVGEMTYGKPVGMNSMSFCDQTIVPITFKSANSQDYGDYFLGMEVDCGSADDYRHDFGDPEEASVHEALYLLENGRCSENAALKSAGRAKYLEDRIPVELKGTGKIDYTL